MTVHSSRPSHVPFNSIYRENFEVVAERRGRFTLYPHTEQLPLLLRAINLEFYGKLPDRFARVDHRADGFHKNVLRTAAMIFGLTLNRTRPDGVRLFDLPDPNLVFKLAVVQQITEDAPLGKTHRFRFYAGKDFFPEILLSGRRLVFADHVLQRFSKRVPNHIGEDLSNFLEIFYGGARISMPCGPGRAFIAGDKDTFVAFPYREQTPGEYFIATSLSVNEINSLQMEFPPCIHNFHYNQPYVSPARRHWNPIRAVQETHDAWLKKTQLQSSSKYDDIKWNGTTGHAIRDITIQGGLGPGSQIMFLDHVPGPHIMDVRVDDEELLLDEMELCRDFDPTRDWPAAFAKRDAILRGELAAKTGDEAKS